MKLYIYDHCPYCIKAKMIFGIKEVKFDLLYLLNDNEKTPISMIGEKMLPILEIKKDDYMAESLDIISYIDNLNGKPTITKKQNKKLSDWLSTNGNLVYTLAMPRWVQAPLEEFKTQSARDYFTKKKESYIGPFKEALLNSASLIDEIEYELEVLQSFFKPQQDFINGSLSLDDFHLFALLRSLSLVKGLKFPEKVQAYSQKMSKKSKVNLYHDIAI